MSRLHNLRARILVAALFALALLLFIAHLKSPREQNPLDRALVWITAPLQDALVWAVDGVAGLWNSYVGLVGVEEENTSLRKQVDELSREVSRVRELEAENQRLRELTGMRDRMSGTRVVGGRVVAVGPSPVVRTLRIDVGSEDGVRVGQAVLAGAGLVGRISGVVGGYSEVELLVDSRSAVDVLVGEARARGILRGQGEDETCRVVYLRRTSPVAVGDSVVTSGVGSTFPGGLLVGTLTRVTTPTVGVFREAEVAPAVSFQSLEEVLVLVPAAPVKEP
jgi:rod shape-determining protein MreC